MLGKIFFKFGDLLDHISKKLSLTLLSLMVGIMILEVIFRNVYMSLTWSDEVATTFLGTWFIFVGGAVALRASQLICIQFVVGIFPKRIGQIITVLGELMTLSFLGVVIVYGIEFVELTMDEPSPVLMLPMGYAYLSIPVGCSLMFYQTIVVMLEGKSIGGGGSIT